jgi:DNA modification methylase
MIEGILTGNVFDILPTLEPESVNCCITSPPYWGLRDYGTDAQLGLEPTPESYVDNLVAVFREVRRVLRDDGTLWLNLGDSYNNTDKWGGGQNPGKHTQTDDGRVPSHDVGRRKPPPTGLKPKDLCMIPARLAMALQADGWWLRSEIVWAKPNGMPGSQGDRCTSAHEMVYMLTKSARYWSDFDAIKTPPRESTMARLMQHLQLQSGSHRANAGAKTNGPMKAMSGKQRGHGRRHDGFNDRWDAMSRDEQMSAPVMMRDVWIIAPAQYAEAHFAVMPEELARRCAVAGCPDGGSILDPFCGSGTTGAVAYRLGRKFVGIELNPEYAALAEKRVAPWRDQLQMEVNA